MNLFIAVPSYDGKLTVPCAEAILKGCHVLRDEGHKVMPFFYSGNPYIAAARNICVHEFMKTDCDEMVFIDADVGFDNRALSQLISHDKDMVAGVYPYKQDNEGYPAIIYFDPVTRNCKEEETGLVTAEVVPTGFLRIRRSVFDKMIEHYGIKRCADKMYSFFDTGVLFADDDKWYGEDVYFCKRWRDMGGQIFIDPNLNFVHTGTKNWRGNLHEWLMGRRVDKWQASLDAAEGINGWTSDGELQFLGQLAAKSDSIVEVGSWKGRSTKVLLELCKGKVYSVDHWQGSKTDMSSVAAAGKDIFGEFFENVGHYPNLEILRGDSIEMSKCFNGAKVDMVFIDADHSYEAVKADIEAWLPKCRKYICGHDYNFPPVKEAVDEKFGTKVHRVERIWWVDLGA